MNFFTSLLQKVKKPKGILIFLVFALTVVFSGVSIALAVINSPSTIIQILSYVCYGIAGVSLGYSVYIVVIYAPNIKQNTVTAIKKTNFGKRLLEQYDFRTVVLASVTFFINVAFVVMHGVLAITTKAYFWYFSLASYYALLVALRFGLVTYHKKKGKLSEKENIGLALKKYKTCGAILTVIPLCLLIPIFQIVFLNKAFVYQGWTVFAFSAYAFFKIITAIINLIKAGKKTDDLTLYAIRDIGLADALVSIFSLQTALLFTFSEQGTNFAIFNALTGAVVCALTIAIGVVMLIKSKKYEQTKE